MNLNQLFEIGRVQVRGSEYGWISTDVDLQPGMPFQVEGFGAINFSYGNYWFTPDGQEGEPAHPGSLGHGAPGVQHAQLIGRIGKVIFPIGSNNILRAPVGGRLAVAHNDTKEVFDNDGAWDVRVSVPVRTVQLQRSAPNAPGASLSFSGPWGISGVAHINLPPWIQNPRPRYTIHSLPAHPTDPRHGVFCCEVDVPILAWHFRKAMHMEM